LIYDTRFGSSPLHTLPDHINKFNFPLDLAVTPDSRFLFASGSDRRIGLWSTITGERIHPISEDEPPGPSSNPLKRIFPGLVQKLAVKEDYGLLMGCGAEVMHFGKSRPGRGRRDFGHGSGEDDSEESMDEDEEDEMAQRVRLEELD
jgi:WD repeat-containing protein 21A